MMGFHKYSLLAAAMLFQGALAAEQGSMAFLDKYCVGCHNAEDWAGSLAFDLLDQNQLTDHLDVWEEVVKKLRGDLMPPVGQAERPPADEKCLFIVSLEDRLDALLV